MKVSRFGHKIGMESGIGQLMDDLGVALTKEGVLMLGGGNPAHIPAVQEYFRRAVEALLADGHEFGKVIGNYDPPQGNIAFVEAICGLLQKEFGWDIGPGNVALTNGSQSAFFILFNLFAGEFEDGAVRKILFPLAPEYIGYADLGLAEDMFVSVRPEIEHLDERMFKYRVDFDALQVTDEIGGICVSRPTNPTGNVLTDGEIGKLSDLAAQKQVPLIIDNAYGTPFPHIIFTDARPVWNKNTIVCMSLSKLGLPAARTGIIIASEEVVRMVAKVNAIISLAPGGLGASIATSLVKSGEIIRLSREIIRPYYKAKADAAVAQLNDELAGVDFHIHKPEGAIFLWLWFRGLPITCCELYERLKKRGVLVVPGHYFFPGLAEDWGHKHECIRVNHSGDAAVVRKGLSVIAAEARLAYGEH